MRELDWGGGADGGQDHQESRAKADYFYSRERDCIKLNCHGLAKAPDGQARTVAFFVPAHSCTNEICQKEQQAMGASLLLSSPHLASTKKMQGPHCAAGSPGVTAQLPTSKNKSAPTTRESESTEIGKCIRILS